MKKRAKQKNERKTGEVPASVLTEESLQRLRGKNKRGRIKRAVMLALSVIVIICVFIALCVFVFFKIKEIKVSGTELYSADEIIEESGVTVGENLFTVDEKAVSDALSSGFPFIGKSKLIRRIPGTLEIAVKEDSATFYTELYGEYFALSDDLRVLQSTESAEEILEKYPELRKISVEYVSEAIVGKSLSFDNDNYYSSLTEFIEATIKSGYYDNISEIDFRNRFAIKLLYKGRFDVVLGDSDNTDVKLNFVESISNDLGDTAKASIEMNDAKKAYVIVETR